jgi:hypothetical protein
MTKYERLRQELEKVGTGTMKCFGPSMKPILSDACLNTYEVRSEYEVGDIVFCKVKGRYIDAHKITKKAADGKYLISNNHGHDNGWTRTIYGKVVRSEDNHGNVKVFP